MTTPPIFIKLNQYPPMKSNPKLYPIRPYHERYRDYIAKREQIFTVDAVTNPIKKIPKRSTIRLREYYKRLKINSKYIISSIINNTRDKRFYAKVMFLDFCECGLLDTGANISCIGSSLATYDFSQCAQFSPVKSWVKTADGSIQKTLGYLEVDVQFQNESQRLKFLIVPAFTQRLILGLDFWKAFRLAEDVFESAIVSEPFSSPNPSVFSVVNDDPQKEKTKFHDETKYPLQLSQKQQLDIIIDLFPSFSKQGLGRTKLIERVLGEAKPVKQRFYPVSPAVEKLIFQEVDRMLNLGVIEPSNSAWSSPMRLVVKPNKIRLCLDARKINQVTKKDAYPLPSIEGILDLKDAYWQVALSEKYKALTAFTVPGRPLYQFVVMPFGLCNAAQTMCRLMDQIIPADLKHCVFGYLDDLVIITEDFPTHISVLVRIADEFRKANLTLNIEKCQFCVVRSKYLEFIIGHGGYKPILKRLNPLRNGLCQKHSNKCVDF